MNLKISTGKEVVKNPKNFEEILEVLGGCGPFQILVMFLYLLMEIPTAFAIFIPTFVGRFPKEWLCNTNLGNSSTSTSVRGSDVCSCNGTLSGKGEEAFSVVSEWHLICDKMWISDFIVSVQMAGLLLGGVFGSQMADWYGRKRAFLLSILLMGLGGSVSAVSTTPYIYALSRFCSGAGIQCFINVTSAGVMEFMPPKCRSLSNCIGPLGEGIMILSVLAYVIHPWRVLYWATVAPFIAILFIYPVLPESPRWLLKNGRIEEAQSVLDFIAKVNGKPKLEAGILKAISESEAEKQGQGQGSAAAKVPGYLDFVRKGPLRKKTLFVMAIWFSWSLTYYGVSFNIKNLEGHIHLNVFLQGLANALGQRSTLLINDSLGRRLSLFASMTFGALFLVIPAVISLVIGHSAIPGNVTLAMCCLSLFGTSATRSTAKLVTGESFPTNVRAMSFGISGIAITLGGVLSPQLALLGTYWPAGPYLILAVVSVSGSLVSLLMKETMGTNLDSEEEEEEVEQTELEVVKQLQ